MSDDDFVTLLADICLAIVGGAAVAGLALAAQGAFG